MKNVGLVVLAAVLSFTSVFAAEEKASFTLQLDTVKISEVQVAFPKVKMRPLFSESEQQLLGKLKHTRLLNTYIIGPIHSSQASDFVEKFQLRFPKLKLEKNDRVNFNAITPDPLLNEQWAIKNTGREVRVDVDDLRTQALNVIRGEDLDLPSDDQMKNLKPVTVAVLDTGLDITHADIRPNLRSKTAECEALTTYLDCMTELGPDVKVEEAENKCLAKVGNIDRDGNGYPMDCVGWSVTSSLSENPKSPLSRVLGTPDMGDDLGHGTHVAGIIAAAQNNGMGVKGVAPNVKILPIRVIETPPVSPLRPQSTDQGNPPDPSEDSLKMGKSSVELIARGLLYAITEKVQIINMSLGWPATINSAVIADMIKLAEDQGIAVVAAAGNDSTDSLVLPCSFSGVICVGAYGPDGKRASYSNRGPGVDLLAPGTSILSTYPISLRARFFTDLQGYEFMTGTSMASPMASGALAILLGQGYNLDEALARLLSGARYESSNVGENLRIDVSKSLNLTPRPWVRTVERAPIRMIWRNRVDVLQGSFHVRNLWKNISRCQVKYRLSPTEMSVTPDTLQKNLTTVGMTSDCGAWKSGEVKTFSFPIQILGTRASRDLILNADLSYVSDTGVSYTQTIQVGVQIVPTPDLIANVLSFQNSAIQGKQIGQGTLVRTVVAADSKSQFSKPEYLVMSRVKDGIAIQLLTARKSSDYRYSNAQTLTDLSWGFLVAHRYYSQEAKATRIALLFRKTSEISGLTQIRFDLYDENLEKQIRSFSYDGSYAPVPENFRWTTLGGKDAILFISNGKEPPSTDVWHQVPDETVVLRCFVLNSDGVLSEVKVDKNDPQVRIVDLLPLRPEDTEKGENALLVIRGKDYRLNYVIGHFNEGVVQSLQPFEISPYRNMGFLAATPLLTDAGPASGNVLSSGVGRGKMRSTTLMRTGYNTISNGDFRFAPMSSLDGISRIVGGFHLNGKDGFFAQTNWDLQYHEFANGKETVVKTSLNRFSFLPSLVSQKAFFPILVKNEKGESEPTVLAADIGSGFFNLSAILPERDASGKVVGLLRPALLGFEGSESGCSFIGNPVWDSERAAYRMNSFCGDSIHSVLLQLPE